MAVHFVDLSHVVEHGMVTYPGLPGPVISDHPSFDDSRSHYAPGTEFRISHIEMVGNTGTYLDTPAHRYTDGWDLADLPLEKVAGVLGIVVDAPGAAIGPEVFADVDVTGRAVLVRTGWSRHWRTETYGAGGHPHLTAASAESLADRSPALVGIDSLNIDSTEGGERPAHSLLLAAGIPIIEHLCELDRLPGTPFSFFAVPMKARGLVTSPVRAFARWEDHSD